MTTDAGVRRSSWKALAGFGSIVFTVALTVGSIALSFCPPRYFWLGWAVVVVSLSVSAIFIRDNVTSAFAAPLSTEPANRRRENLTLAILVAGPILAAVIWTLFSTLRGA
jgi:hypothetical protein